MGEHHGVGWSNETPTTIGIIMRINIDDTLSAHVTDRETLWKFSPGDAELLSMRSCRSLGSRPSYDWFSVGKDSIAMEFIGSHSLTIIVDSVSVLSCEVTKIGFSNKDAISIASDFKFLLNESKAVGKFLYKDMQELLSYFFLR
ncbi:hypothetical protein YC2023_093548 [Brassica napus]